MAGVVRVLRRRGLVLAVLLSAAACAPTPQQPAQLCLPEETAPYLTVGERPRVHFTPPDGWMNDPAGLFWRDGTWHLHYQRDPHEVFTADVRWGQATSTDLLHWLDGPEALTPDAQLGVPFTGSAVLDVAQTSGLCPPGQSCPVAVFTYAQGPLGQVQGLAASADGGRTWQPYAGNPVLAAPGAADFRDPMVQWDALRNRWLLVLGVQGAARFYSSADLKTWTQLADFALPADLHGAVECPALLPLPGPDGQPLWLLKLDVNPGLMQAGLTRYWLGHWDGGQFHAQTPALPLDGPDFYAAQAFSGVPDGRVVWLGWLNNWQYAMLAPWLGYRGQLSVPRDLAVRATADGPRLVQRPAAELAALESPCALAAVSDLALGPTQTLLADAGEAFVLRATLRLDAGTGDPGAGTMAGLTLRHPDGTRVVVRYDAARRQLEIDRSASAQADFAPGFAAPVSVDLQAWADVQAAAGVPSPPGLASQSIDLTLVVDRQSVEVFAAGGAAVVSVLVFPSDPHVAVDAWATHGAARLLDLSIHGLARALR